MLKRLIVHRFKSLVELELDLGQVNVFIGANGSGKSNLLEAIGVLGAAAFGRVDDETLLRRGVRPGVPRLYKTAFPQLTNVPHIHFAGESASGARYDVTLWNPLDNPSPAWKFKTEKLHRSRRETVLSRSTTSAGKHNQEQGFAALKTAELSPDDPAFQLMDNLRTYSIYCPNTPSLRGLAQDVQSREPVGLAGGRLPEAVRELRLQAMKDSAAAQLLDDVRELIDWAHNFSAAPSVVVPLSPSAARSRFVIRFVDRFMAKGRNALTGYDASEGALYVLFLASLALHPKAPRCMSVDNVDQSLNPRLAKGLVGALCKWAKEDKVQRQWLLTVHNPAVLDGLPLLDPQVRLFAVERDSKGHTRVRRIDLAAALKARPDEEWTLSRMWVNGLLGAVPNI